MAGLPHTVLEPIQEFGLCLKQILEKKQVSASELARLLSYKSRNSIFRILDGEGAHTSRRAFLDRLFETDALSLTLHEREMLTQALEVSRVGLRRFLNNRAMQDMLVSEHPQQQSGGAGILLVGEDAQAMSHGYVLDDLMENRELHLMITGCYDRRIFEALHRRVSGKQTRCHVSITHYIYTGDEEVVHNISAIQPLLYEDYYTAYCIQPGMFSAEKEWLYRSNCIFAHAVAEDGSAVDQPFILVDEGCFCPLRSREAGGFHLLETVFDEDRLHMSPLKTSFDLTRGAEDYVAYTEQYRRLEQNRAIYTVKPDIPINFVHPDIALSALVEGVLEQGRPMDAARNESLQALYEIQVMRWENFFRKRKPTHTIFSPAEMERFARTGRQSDHFFMMRAYTPEERVAILTHIRDQARTNPHFRIHFFKWDYPAPQMEIGLYEGMGTLLTKPNTDYHLNGGHTEALITQQTFCSQYRDFFLGDLLEQRVMDEAQTMALLDDLILLAKGAA